MSDEEEGTIRYGGRNYLYDDDYKATYLRAAGEGDGKGGEGLLLRLRDRGRALRLLSVEEWGDKDSGYEYEVFVSESLDPESVEVLVIGDGAGS